MFLSYSVSFYLKKNLLYNNLCLFQLINAVVLLILLSALNDPVQYHYHLTSSELGTDLDVMDDASMFESFNPL